MSTTITGLPNATTPLSGTERVPMDQAGATKDATTQDIADLALADAGAARTALGLATDDSPTFAGATFTGLVTANHIHGNLAGSVYFHVKNTSGGELTKGTPIRVTGAVGDTTTLQIAAADAASSATMPAVGILDATLAVNAEGHAVIVGEVTGLNTGSFTAGQTLYVASGGGLTTTRPASNAQAVAIVGRVQSETGTIAVTLDAVSPTPSDIGAAAAGAIGSSGLTMAAGILGRESGTGAIGVFSIGSGLSVVGGALVVTGGGTGTVTSVGLTVPTGLTVSGSPITTSGTLAISLAAGYSIPTTASQGNWDTAYSERLRWDGGSTGLDAGTARTSLGLGGAAVLNVGTTAGTVAAGDDARFHDAVTLGASVADVLDLTGQVIGADDPGADRILFWDDSESKLRHLALGGGLVIDGTTLTVPVEIGLACSDETSDLTTGAAKVTFRMPYAMTLTAVRASVTTAPTGSTLVVDINEDGTSILSTKLSIDAGEKTSTTAAVPAVISDSSLADDAEVTIDIDQIGATVAGAGLKVWLIGRRA